jgi:hypothetical protein
MKQILILVMLSMALPVLAQKWTADFDFVDNCVCGLSLVKKKVNMDMLINPERSLFPAVY